MTTTVQYRNQNFISLTTGDTNIIRTKLQAYDERNA